MNLEHLDITLKNGRLINDYLAGWLMEAANNPDGVKLEVVTKQKDYQIIELQDKEGIAVGGIIFHSAEGTVHVIAAIDPKREPLTKRRSLEEMVGAQMIALEKEKYQSKALSFYSNRFYLYLLIAFVALLFWSIGSGNFAYLRWLH
jgi:hypothetical protein